MMRSFHVPHRDQRWENSWPLTKQSSLLGKTEKTQCAQTLCYFESGDTRCNAFSPGEAEETGEKTGRPENARTLEPGGPADTILPISPNANHDRHIPIPSVLLLPYSLPLNKSTYLTVLTLILGNRSVKLYT